MSDLDIPAPPEPTIGYYDTAKPRWSFWRWLGFRHAHASLPEEWEGAEGYAPGYFHIGVRVKFGWSDMLRLLVSRRVHIVGCVQSDVEVHRLRTYTAIAVLPPSRNV